MSQCLKCLPRRWRLQVRHFFTCGGRWTAHVLSVLEVYPFTYNKNITFWYHIRAYVEPVCDHIIPYITISYLIKVRIVLRSLSHVRLSSSIANQCAACWPCGQLRMCSWHSQAWHKTSSSLSQCKACLPSCFLMSPTCHLFLSDASFYI